MDILLHSFFHRQEHAHIPTVQIMGREREKSQRIKKEMRKRVTETDALKFFTTPAAKVTRLLAIYIC